MPDADSNVTLAIEAAGSDASVAIGRGPTLLHVEPISNTARHDDDLMPAIERSFTRIASSPKELRAVFVSVGPGGFTGLRIAVSTAKMLALALNCRIVAVKETDATMQAAGSANPMAVCLAGKHGHYWTAFHTTGTTTDGQLLAIAEVIDTATSLGITSLAVRQPPDRLTDLAPAAAAASLRLIEVHPDASHVWHVGRRMAAAGCFAAPEHLLPLYPREPEAVRLWRDRHV